MLPDDMACNPRNAFPGTVYSNSDRKVDLYGDASSSLTSSGGSPEGSPSQSSGGIEVDYRGYEVTVENFIRLLTDRWDESIPRSKRLLSNSGSNILIYMTGHGGDEFLKFQDAEEISAFDLADAFGQMWEGKRYNEVLFMVDTCQANTMYSKFYAPGVIATGSSDLGQSSYSHHADNDVGVAVIDRYTYYNLNYLEREVESTSSKKTLGDLFDSYDESQIHSHPGLRWDLFPGGEEAGRSRLIMDFFGNIQGVEVGDGIDSEMAGIRPNDTTEAEWREDLLGLAKKIQEIKERAEEQEREKSEDLGKRFEGDDGLPPKSGKKENKEAQSPAVEDDTPKPTAKASIRAAKVEDVEHYWAKKVVGGLVLGGLGVAWAAGSYMEGV